MTFEKGTRIRLSIEKIVYPGRRLARHEGRVYFTDEGLPGETVEIEILKERASFVEARTTAVLSPSPRRIPARCGHFSACGSYQVLPYSEQLDLKKSQLREMFRRLGTGPLFEPEVTASPLEWNYRNKIRFSVRGSGPDVFLAYHSPGSRAAFVPTDGRCHLASEASCAAARTVLEAVRDGGLTDLEDVEARESRTEGTLLLNLFWRKRRPEKAAAAVRDALAARFPVSGLVSWAPGRSGRSLPFLEDGREILLERAAGLTFEIGAGSFFQVNGAILPLVLEAVSEAAGLRGREIVADVYSGVGTFGLALARSAARVFVIESFPDNVRRLEANIVRNGLGNVEVLDGSAEAWMKDLAGRRLDTVILDPPRKGLDPAVVRALIERPAGKIIYLSCNPATLIRDLGLLGAAYAPASVRLFDFFPQTPHIETLAVLVRK